MNRGTQYFQFCPLGVSNSFISIGLNCYSIIHHKNNSHLSA